MIILSKTVDMRNARFGILDHYNVQLTLSQKFETDSWVKEEYLLKNDLKICFTGQLTNAMMTKDMLFSDNLGIS